MHKPFSTDVKPFFSFCINSLFTTEGTRFSQYLDPFVHETKPNDLIQLDYLELCQNLTGDKYIQLIRSDHFGYCRFSRLRLPMQKTPRMLTDKYE